MRPKSAHLSPRCDRRARERFCFEGPRLALDAATVVVSRRPRRRFSRPPIEWWWSYRFSVMKKRAFTSEGNWIMMRKEYSN